MEKNPEKYLTRVAWSAQQIFNLLLSGGTPPKSWDHPFVVHLSGVFKLISPKTTVVNLLISPIRTVVNLFGTLFASGRNFHTMIFILLFGMPFAMRAKYLQRIRN